ncbi:DinB family protein [Pedobacter westerhofensis]|nr:DinB family protein [Pedobacter westerhofensis]
MEFYRIFPHMVNHSRYHRGQLVTLLRRQAGFTDLCSTDLFTYYRVIGID